MNSITLGFYGFGEAASTFAIDLRHKWPDMNIIAYEKFVTERTRERARLAAAIIVPTLEDMVAQVDVIGSMVTGSTSLQAAKEVCGLMRRDQLYVDFNSISPRVKEEIAKLFADVQVPMVDAAVMGSIPENGLGVSILISGMDAPKVSETLNILGFHTQAVGTKAGEAAAIKMVRSVFSKGLEGLFVEMLLAGKKYGVQEYVVNSVAESLEHKQIREVMNTLVVSQAYHSARKKAEMDYVIEVLKDANIEPMMSTATRDCFAWLSGLGLKDTIVPETATYHTVIDAIEQTLHNK